jgi:uncharacterized protein YecE (DUF72 family)
MREGMQETLIGAGGWGYFTGGLEAYARGFRFVELNASFYRPVPETYARRWRSRVPSDFAFAVKANRTITHSDGLRASSAGRRAFGHDLRIARILRSPIVILETPASLVLGHDEVAGLRNLAGMVPSGIRLGLEARAHGRGNLPDGLRTTMASQAILDVVDLSQTSPRVPDDTVYSRLFGLGPHNVYQFDDRELREIDRAGGDAIRVAFAFHGVRMYQDAARFLTFKRTGEFPPATGSRGLASLEEVLRPDARFPASKEDLVQGHGWKVFDVDGGTRAHAATFLERLPPRVYENLHDVVSELRTVSLGLPP